MTSLSEIANKWGKNIQPGEILSLKNARSIELVNQIYEKDKKDFRTPKYFCDEIKSQKSFSKEIFQKLSLYLELKLSTWISKAQQTDLVDLLVKCIQAVVDLNRPNSEPAFREEDVIDIYQCIWLITASSLSGALIKNDPSYARLLVNSLFFSIVPSYTHLFSIILKILSNLIINDPDLFYIPLIASMEITAQIRHSPTIFKWIIDTLDPSRGMDFINSALDFLYSVLNGTGEDSPTKYSYEAIMVKDGIVDKLKQFTSFEGIQDNNSISTFIKLIQLHQNVIFSLFEFDISKEKECRVNMFNPLDTVSSFEFLSQLVNDKTLMNSFILSTIDINNHTSSSYIRHLNKINYFTRIGLRQGYSFEDSFSKAIQMDFDLNADIPNVVDESTISVPSTISDYEMISDFKNLYSHVSCDYQFTGFWDLPDEPEEMKKVTTLEEKKRMVMRAEQLINQNKEQEEALKKHEIRRILYEKKLKELLGDTGFSDFLYQVENYDTTEMQEQLNKKAQEQAEQAQKPPEVSESAAGEMLLAIAPPPPPPPPPPPGTKPKGVEPITLKDYKMEYVINMPSVSPSRISLTVWKNIVPNEFEVDFKPLRCYLEKENASDSKQKKIVQSVPTVLGTELTNVLCIPFQKIGGDQKEFDRNEVLEEIRKNNEDIDDENILMAMTKREILKRKIKCFKKSLLILNDDGFIPESFIGNLSKLTLREDNKPSKYEALCQTINSVINKSDKEPEMYEALMNDFQRDVGMIIKVIYDTPFFEERLDFINFINYNNFVVSKFFPILNDTKKAFTTLKESEKFKHFLEMSLKIVNMMAGSKGRAYRSLKLGFIIQFLGTAERKKNLEAFWVTAENNESVKGFMDDLQLFEPILKLFDPGETYNAFKKAEKKYKELKDNFGKIKANYLAMKNSDENNNNNNNNDNDNIEIDFNDDILANYNDIDTDEVDLAKDSEYLLCRMNKFFKDQDDKVPKYLSNYKADCEEMYSVMEYFDECPSNTNDRAGTFRAEVKNFTKLMLEYFNGLNDAQDRIMIAAERARARKRKAEREAKAKAEKEARAKAKAEQAQLAQQQQQAEVPQQTTEEQQQTEASQQATEEQQQAEAPQQTTEDQQQAEAPQQTTEDQQQAEAPQQTTEDQQQAEAPQQTTEEQQQAEAPQQATEDQQQAEAPQQTNEEQ